MNPASSSLLSPGAYSATQQLPQQPNFSSTAINDPTAPLSSATQDSSPNDTKEKSDAPSPETVLPSATKAEKFLLTAADQASGSRNERLNRVIRSKYEAGLLKPYNYVKGYARLSRWMDQKYAALSRFSRMMLMENNAASRLSRSNRFYSPYLFSALNSGYVPLQPSIRVLIIISSLRLLHNLFVTLYVPHSFARVIYSTLFSGPSFYRRSL